MGGRLILLARYPPRKATLIHVASKYQLSIPGFVYFLKIVANIKKRSSAIKRAEI
jgi:hypothetical protein